MKTYALIAALALALPGVADARKVTYYSDRDGDGHYVKRTKNVPDYRYRGYSGYRGGYYGGYRGGYYGSRYRYPSYGYRSYYGYPSYSYGYPYYSSPGLSFVYSSTPRYTTTSRYYSQPSYRSVADSLEVDVQRELRSRGYYRGPIDGDIGPGSRAAIRAYQADRGLAITGRIDARLLRSLGI